MNIVQALQDRSLLGRVFPDLDSWSAWVVFLRSVFSLPIPAGELEAHTALYREHTGREELPTGPAREGWVVAGRRAGKSRIAALVGVYLAAFRNYGEFLAPGERAVVMLIAGDRKQARVLLRYVRAFLELPMLKQMVERETKEAIDLNNGASLEIHTSSYKSTRGYSVAALLADEVAFWQSEDSASPDIEVINAIKPGMSSIPGSLLLAISSPYARRGALWRAYKNHYGKDGDSVLIWQAPTVAMNPTVDARFIADAYEEDEASASAEYGAQFRRDIESFVSIEVVEGCTVAGRTHLPPDANVEYYGFVDPSGGARDSFCLAIGHRTDEMVVVDMLAERRAPLSPESVVGEFAGFLNQYRISSVVGDKYAGGWPREQFQKHGIGYDASAAPKSDLYKDLLPILNSGKIELLDNKRLINQLVGLERRTSRSGKDSIDHGPGGYDDVVNVVAGLASAAELKKVPIHTREFLWG